MNINKLQKEDYYNGFLQLLEQLTVVNSDKISYNNFCNHFDNMSSNIFVIKNKDNKIIATASLFIECKFIHNLSKVGHIEDVVVDKNYRSQGIGKLLIDYLVNYCKKEGCYKVILDCSENNKLFYQNCGFKQKGIEMAVYFD